MLPINCLLLLFPLCGKNTLEVGISHRDAALQAGLLQNTASERAPPVLGWQVTLTIVSQSSKARVTAWLVLVCRRRVTLHITPCCTLDLEYPPQILSGAIVLSCLAWRIELF